MTEFSLKDLTDEAKRFGLDPAMYDTLRAIIRKRIEPEIQEATRTQERAQIRAEVKKEVREELLPDLRKSVENEMRPTLLASVKEEVRQATIAELKVSCLKEAREAALAEAPSATDRAHFLSYFQDMEIECATYADIAAQKARSVWDQRTLLRAIRQPALFILMVGIIPLLATLHHYGWAPDSFRFVATGIGAAVAIITLAITNSDLFERLQRDYDALNGIAAEYRMLAGQAKRNMLSGRTSKTRFDLRDITDGFQMSRRNVDGRFAPEGTDIERTREKVTQRLLVANVDSSTRIADFDEIPAAVPEDALPEAHRAV